jgi:DNA-damage-inducible protein J
MRHEGITKTYQVIPETKQDMSEKMTPVVAKVLPSEKERFYAATSQIGTTPSNAIRMFISAFNKAGTFPFEMLPPDACGASADGRAPAREA